MPRFKLQHLVTPICSRGTLAACMLLGGSAVGHAQDLPSFNLPTFSAQVLTDDPFNTVSSTPETAITVLSSTAAATRLRFDSMDEVLDTASSGGSHAGSDPLTLYFDAAPRYRITRLTFTIEFSGVVAPVSIPPELIVSNGETSNAARGSLAIYPGAPDINVTPDASTAIVQPNVVGTYLLELALDNVRQRDAFGVALFGGADATAEATDWLCQGEGGATCQAFGFASLIASNPVLTVYTELLPIPEPPPFLLFGAGAAMLALARQRKVLLQSRNVRRFAGDLC